MKAIILAAGRGSRLQGFTEDRPKCLNYVGERTLLKWQLSALRAGGVDEVIIISGYKAEMFHSFSEKTVHNHQWETTNMVKSLLCAKEEFNQHTIVSYSDILYSSDIIAKLCTQKENAVVVYDKHWKDLWKVRFEDPLKDAESLRITQNNQIVDIGQKVSRIDEIQGQYLGLMRYSPKAFSWIIEYVNSRSHQIDMMDMTTLIREMIHSGYPFHGMPIRGGWCEIDTPSDLSLANRMYKDGQLKLK